MTDEETDNNRNFGKAVIKFRTNIKFIIESRFLPESKNAGEDSGVDVAPLLGVWGQSPGSFEILLKILWKIAAFNQISPKINAILWANFAPNTKENKVFNIKWVRGQSLSDAGESLRFYLIKQCLYL